MTIFEDIKSDIESNGGHITKVEVYDDTVDITYIDSDGNTITKMYSITINDDGSEDWKEVS